MTLLVAGRGKRKIGPFSPGQIVEYLKPAMKALHKLEVMIAKICLLATVP